MNIQKNATMAYPKICSVSENGRADARLMAWSGFQAGAGLPG
jgi:hypothetical protein